MRTRYSGSAVPMTERADAGTRARPAWIPVAEVARLFAVDRGDVERMRVAADLDVLPNCWRDYFRKRVDA